MIPENELELLRAFDGRGNSTLSAYLSLDDAQSFESTYEAFMQQVQASLDECGPNTNCQEALREDMEIVGIYLRTNGHRRHAGIAIFSCASELFWRAYALPVPLPNHVTVGPNFNLEPLTGGAGQN